MNKSKTIKHRLTIAIFFIVPIVFSWANWIYFFLISMQKKGVVFFSVELFKNTDSVVQFHIWLKRSSRQTKFIHVYYFPVAYCFHFGLNICLFLLKENFLIVRNRRMHRIYTSITYGWAKNLSSIEPTCNYEIWSDFKKHVPFQIMRYASLLFSGRY